MSYSITDQCIGCMSCAKVCPVQAIKGEKKSQHVIVDALCIECGSCGRVCPKSCVHDDTGHAIKKLKRTLWAKPAIDASKCYACENCVDVCPVNALAMAGEKLSLYLNKAVLVSPDACVSCGWCAANCMFDAIIIKAGS